MSKNFIIAFKVSIFTMLITGLIYPLFIMGMSYTFFYRKATGSLIVNEEKTIVGSELIGQDFKNSAYFFPRPSDAGKGYDGTRSGGSNLGPTSKKLLEKINERTTKLRVLNAAPIPMDLVTSSASGLDPHISSKAAYWQAPRIALERNVSLQRILSIIDDRIEHPKFYIFGSPRLNVLKLNLALDQFFGSAQGLK